MKTLFTMDSQADTVQNGDVWQLGKHLLYCGDSSTDDFIKLCRSHHARFAFADPPYNAGVVEWDKDFMWKHDWLIGAAPVVAVTPGLASMQSFLNVVEMPYVWSMSYWIKNGMTRGALGFGNWVYVALFSHDSLRDNLQDHAGVSITKHDNSIVKHKGRKPMQMMLHIIEQFTRKDEIVIDPFLGTGTTLAACERLQRVCIGAELSIEYCKNIIERWENMTGQRAIKWLY